MTRVEGTLRFVDLGAGQWVLQTASGARHPLDGAVDRGWADREVVVHGTFVDGLGFGVSADRTLQVHRIALR
ncbi:MAG: hypothetical protein H6733_15875 [Alphaproteobacteria bacterium]|nr:hypothetical protein [Alphaproteobacteria bacterium]